MLMLACAEAHMLFLACIEARMLLLTCVAARQRCREAYFRKERSCGK